MKFGTGICLMVGLLFLGNTLKAQDTLQLNFGEAVKLALENNAQYNTKLNNQETQEVIRKQAFYNNFPTVGVGLNSRRVTGQQTQQVDDGFVVDNFTNYSNSASVDASMPIFNMFRRINTYKAEKFREEAGVMDLVRSEQEVVFQVANQYLQVLLSQELLKIAEENLENQQELLRQIEGYVEVGLSTLSDQYNQQSEVARLEAVTYDAEIQLMNDVLVLAETLQLKEGEVPSIQPIKESLSKVSYGDRRLDQLVDMAMSQHPGIKREELLHSAFGREAKAAKAGFYPSLNAYYGYSSFSTSIVDRTFKDQFFEFNPSSVIGISLNIPIFSNLNNKASYTRGKMALKNQQIAQEAFRKKVYQQVRLAHANYQAALKKTETTKVQLKAAEEAATVIGERYRLGLNNFVDLATANRQLVQAQSDMAQAKYTQYFQDILLMYAVGILETENVRHM
ncbi:TolC family protein [Echinicola shivajiensis]|uniref:TolC family protein n=1 Tax=Echinicola shivajiensis TaxID=1035916 RepID=UPI001BFC571D|nr:TolC family protein [Echinicola shivajiensis]